MSYRLEAGEPIPAGIKRIAIEQIDQALDQLYNQPEGPNEAIHDARKRFKKIRAVLRLVRDEIGQAVYKRENVCYRDAGRLLSDVRDSNVMVETVDLLRKHFADQLAAGTFDTVRAELVAQHEAVFKKVVEEEKAIDEVTAIIETARLRVEEWPVKEDDFLALHGGLRRVYKRGRKRMHEAYADPLPENFHEWRKRVKYLWYHIRILQNMWPDLLDELADQLHDLSDYLGDDHDLIELRHTVLDRPDMFETEEDLKLLVALIDRRREELEAAARPLGERIYTEAPDTFVKRINSYWMTWQKAQAQKQKPLELTGA